MLSKIRGYRPDLPTYGFSHNGGRKEDAVTGKECCARPILNDPRSNRSLDEAERAFGKPPKDIGESVVMLSEMAS